MSQIDRTYFRWEAEERKKFRRQQTAKQPKCRQCGNTMSLLATDGLCDRCKDADRRRRKQKILDSLAERVETGDLCAYCLQPPKRCYCDSDLD